jgi:hypothetical protein
MPARKGTRPPAAGRPRKKGTPNKITRDMRALIAGIVDKHADQVSGWITRVAKKNPDRATELWLRANEFITPKLLRAEVQLPPPERELPAWDDMNPVEAALAYQQMLHPTTVIKHLPSVKPYVAPSLPAALAPPRPRVQVLEAAGKPVDVRFTTRPCTQEPVEVPAAAPGAALVEKPARRPAPEAEPETSGGVLASGMEHEHVHTAKADSVCRHCHHLWVIS